MKLGQNRWKQERGLSLVHRIPVILRHILLCLSFVLLYLLSTRPEVIVLSHIGLVAWYPATGLLLALMLAVSPWYAPVACLAGILSESLIYHQPILSFGLTVGAAGIPCVYAASAYLLRGPLAIDLGLRHRRDVVRYVSVTTVAAMGATLVGVGCLAADHQILRSEYWQSALAWFFGDEIGLLGVAPFLLIYVFPWVRTQLSPEMGEIHLEKEEHREGISKLAWLLEAGGQAAMLLAVLWIIFGSVAIGTQRFYLSFVPIIWIAMRQGIRRVVIGLLALNFGIVVALHVYPSGALLTQVGLLMFVVSGLGLLVGSAVSERQRMAIDLLEQTLYLDSLIQNSPLGIVVLDRTGKIELTNDAFKTLFLYSRSELAAANIHSIFPPDDEKVSSQLPELVFAKRTIQKSIRRRRRDGKTLDLELHVVPVVAHDRVRGSYIIYKDISEQTRAFEIERQHAESLNGLIKELETRTQQTTLLNEMSNLLDCCTVTEEAGTVIVQSVHSLFPDMYSGTLYVFKSSRNLVETSAHWGSPSASQPLFPPEACWALRRGQLHWSDFLSGGLACTHLRDLQSVACLCVPLTGQKETLGILHLEFTAKVESQIDGDSKTLRQSRQILGTTVAGQIALSLANLRLRETLRDQSIRDPLTGLFNRRFMQESLEREMHRARRKKHALSVLLVDLDHFKPFNDTFGHDAGDFVLQSLADVFRSFFRSDDVACRYGGEEFAFILPEASSHDAFLRANELREKVKQLNLKYDNHLLGKVTLSIGVATFPEHSADVSHLLKMADQSLYRSKSIGRDSVTVASVEPVVASSPA
jgi:diguanylate cyclase (GGDEF)-like protein/PAS domain S-box-containing protein